MEDSKISEELSLDESMMRKELPLDSSLQPDSKGVLGRKTTFSHMATELDDIDTPSGTPYGGQPSLLSCKSNRSNISDYLHANGYYTCISKEPLPLRWSLPDQVMGTRRLHSEDSPAGIVFEAGNVVRMRSFVYKEPYLWAEVMNGGFVCAGVGDSRQEAAGDLLEEYFEPYRLPGFGGEEEQKVAQRKLERQATNALKALTHTAKRAAKQVDEVGEQAASDSSSSDSDEDDDGQAEKILELFKRFDVNRDGTIELEELSSVLTALDPRKWNDSKVKHLMSLMDTNKDRSISYEEFVDWVCGSCRWRKERRNFFKEIGVETGELQEMTDAVARRGSAIRSAITEWKTD